MLMDKPVLALITGNTPGFPPGEVMRETGLGFTHGNGDPESLAEMEKWIAEKIAEKCSGSGTERPSNPATAAYSYPDLAARLCGILDSVLRS